MLILIVCLFHCRRVDEFSEYSDSDSMFQYCKDVQQVQKRLADIQDLVAVVNKEEELFGVEISTFKEIEEIQARVEPFQKLFTITYKWQKSEKKWMDGGFLDLVAEQVESEVTHVCVYVLINMVLGSSY